MATTELVLSTVVKGTETATKSLNDVKGALDGIGKAAKKTGDQIPSFTSKLKANSDGFKTLWVAAGVATTGIVIGIRGAIDEAVKFQNAFVGLKSIADGTGKSFEKSKQFIQDFTKDGLITAGDAATSLKSLFQRWFSLEESIVLLNRFKDSASFGRQSALGLGEAVRGAAEGLKNENSMLVDNAGVTKNVAKMWDDYAKSIWVKTNSLTLAQKREAEYQGVLKETSFQVWDAIKYASGYAGAVARQDAASLKLQQTIGTALMPAMTILTETITKILTPIWEWIGQHPQLSSGIILVTLGITWLTTALIAIGFVIWPLSAAFAAIGVVIGAISGPVLLVIGVLGLLTKAFYDIWKNWATVKPQIIADWESFKTNILSIVWAIVGFVTDKFDAMMRKVDEAINYLANKARQAKEYVSGILSSAWSAYSNFTIQNALWLNWDFSARAKWWPVNGWQTYLVGEKGPELFTPGTTGQIIPNNKLGGGSGITINITGMFGQNAADEISQHILNRLKGASYI